MCCEERQCCDLVVSRPLLAGGVGGVKKVGMWRRTRGHAGRLSKWNRNAVEIGEMRLQKVERVLWCWGAYQDPSDV